ncbi:MAG: hypothetical protein ACI8ZZ_001324 [Gammaproteobacteria bacterium]|jgi:hypothetical protein
MLDKNLKKQKGVMQIAPFCFFRFFHVTLLHIVKVKLAKRR